MVELASRVLRRLGLPPWIALLVVSALLFLMGSASFGISGAHQTAQIGIVGAIVAIAVIAGFAK